MSASESEPETRERSRTYIRGASKREIEESLPLIPEMTYPDLKVKREDTPMFKRLPPLTPAEERAFFGSPPQGPSRGSQGEGKHRAFEELTQEAYKEYLKEERKEWRKNNVTIEKLNPEGDGTGHLRICRPREQMIRESIQNYPECSNFTIQGRPLSDDQMKNIMAGGFQSARAMHRKNQKVEVIDLTKNDDN